MDKFCKVAISGKMGSGKTTLAKAIKKEFYQNIRDLPYRTVQQYSFASKLKEIAIDLFNMPSDPKNKDRVLLQTLGSKMRDIDINVWVKYVLRQIEKDQAEINTHSYGIFFKHLHIIDDMRYKNEYEMCMKKGFYLIRINCPKEIREQRIGSLCTNETHLSETDLDSIDVWDFTVEDNGLHIDALDSIAVDIVKHLLKGMD